MKTLALGIIVATLLFGAWAAHGAIASVHHAIAIAAHKVSV